MDLFLFFGGFPGTRSSLKQQDASTHVSRTFHQPSRRPGAGSASWSSRMRWFAIGGACVVLLATPAAGAQALLERSTHAGSESDDLPEAPQVVQSAQASFADSQAGGAPLKAGTMSGTVLDSNGAVVVGASVTLENMASHEKRSGVSDDAGYFSFASVPDGLFQLTIAAAGFAGWSETSIPMQSGADLDLPRISLKVNTATTEVEVVFPPPLAARAG